MFFSSDYPRLCGGTFFTLLTRAMKKHGRTCSGYNGSLAGITEANLLKALIRVFYPSYPDLALSTEKTNAVRYKQGKNLGIGFDDSLVLNKFDRSVKNEYKKVLLPMNELVKKYIDADAYGIWLVKALLQLISADEHISGDAYFFINYTRFYHIIQRKCFYLGVFWLLIKMHLKKQDALMIIFLCIMKSQILQIEF